MTLEERVKALTMKLVEQAAIAVAAMHDGKGIWEQIDAEREYGWIEDEQGEIVTYDEGRPTLEQARHIAANDPHSVLADVEYKTWILEKHTPRKDDFGIWVCDECSWCHKAIHKIVNAYAPCEYLTGLLKFYGLGEGL